MAELILYAIPAFVLLLVVELLSFKYARDEDLVGYEARDTRTSLTMGGGNVVINAVWKLVVVAVYVGLYELTPLRMPADMWWTYVLLFFADDLAYYWFHRIHHEVRVFWASGTLKAGASASGTSCAAPAGRPTAARVARGGECRVSGV